MTLGLKDLKDAKKWADEHELDIRLTETKPRVTMKKVFKEADATSLLPHYSFYTKEPRNIAESVLKELECGIQMSGKQNNRFVFVIRDDDDDIVGLAGRDLLQRDNKWKLLGRKMEWVYPQSALEYIKACGWVILVESIGDMLALRNAGYYNVLVMFGLDLNAKLLNEIISLNVKRIVICTNNDVNKKENWGQIAAEKVRDKLVQLIEEEKIEIQVPPKGDLGEMTPQEIKEFIK
jgi:hypothetical protein